ncbi:uncharacterized protein H6S33_008068 [Morchella sextelata]|uniref:uncharacterized protein n=1 Tax=Morchella sextelata TaxID=1174677 RepID=UPI001D044119|nr:uncharacterized protein H6S33_008068 [Morchella sextelata]KAH0603064.1 hypothetical protein H6S33_008068 [Morchella sextelata]
MITYGARKGTGPRAPESISAPVCIWDEYMVTEDEYPGTENPCNQSAPFEEGTDHDHDSETESDVHAPPPPPATKSMKAPPPAAAALPAAAAPASGSKNPTGKVPNGSKTGNATKSVQTDPTTAGDIAATKAVPLSSAIFIDEYAFDVPTNPVECFQKVRQQVIASYRAVAARRGTDRDLAVVMGSGSVDGVGGVHGGGRGGRKRAAGGGRGGDVEEGRKVKR